MIRRMMITATMIIKIIMFILITMGFSHQFYYTKVNQSIEGIKSANFHFCGSLFSLFHYQSLQWHFNKSLYFQTQPQGQDSTSVKPSISTDSFSLALNRRQSCRIQDLHNLHGDLETAAGNSWKLHWRSHGGEGRPSILDGTYRGVCAKPLINRGWWRLVAWSKRMPRIWWALFLALLRLFSWKCQCAPPRIPESWRRPLADRTVNLALCSISNRAGDVCINNGAWRQLGG